MFHSPRIEYLAGDSRDYRFPVACGRKHSRTPGVGHKTFRRLGAPGVITTQLGCGDDCQGRHRESGIRCHGTVLSRPFDYGFPDGSTSNDN